MKNRWLLAIAIIGLAGWTQGVRAESAHRLGAGINHWTVLDDIDVHHIDDNGISWLLTYQYRFAPLFKVEVDFEIFPDDFQGLSGTVYAPQGYLVVGSFVYAAAGIGVYNSDGDFEDDPFYALRAGVDLQVLPQFYLDLNVNYRFAEWANPDELTRRIDGDTLTLGAALRFEF